MEQNIEFAAELINWMSSLKISMWNAFLEHNPSILYIWFWVSFILELRIKYVKAVLFTRRVVLVLDCNGCMGMDVNLMLAIKTGYSWREV